MYMQLLVINLPHFLRGDSQLMPIYASDQNGRSLQTPSPLLKATINWFLFSYELSSNPSILLDFNHQYLA